MIFDFFKRIFWKADEENKKRKLSYELQNESNDQTFKKHCNKFSHNNLKSISKKSPEFIIGKMYLHNQLKANKEKMNPDTKLGVTPSDPFFQSLNHYNKGYNDVTSPANNSLLPEYLKQFTLSKSKKFSEKRQYNKILLTFVPSGKQSKIKDDHVLNNKSWNSYNTMLSKGNCIIKIKTAQNLESIKNSQYYNSDFSSSKVTANENVSAYFLDKNEPKNLIPKLIKSNSLREDLFSNKITKKSFVSGITKKYNERFERRYKDVQEVKKITYLLSKHNQFTREAVLENYLNKSLKVCETVINETGTELPELTIEIMQQVKSALAKASTDEILVESFGLRITRRDIQTLASLNWLNDEIINFYMNLLILRANNYGFPSMYAMNTFFYPKLLLSGHASLKRWTRKIDIFVKDLILIPIHLGIHWCLAVIDFRKKTIKYYDSMGTSNHKCLQALKQYLADEYKDKKKGCFNFFDWSFECEKNIPKQMNGSDCGVFSCMFAEYISADKSLNFNQEDMPYFRNKMIYEILNLKLL